MMINQYLVSRNYQQQADSHGNLELFKNLLQPHFLFNSLNSLYALSLRKSDQTPEAIAGLSQLLERVVTYSRMDLISLSDEVAIIKDYIALERIWLGENSFLLDFQVNGETSSVYVPPLTFYTLVENAFKHGIRKCENRGWITIHLMVKKERVLLKVRNSLNREIHSDAPFPAAQNGLGIKAVKMLLEASFRKSYYLDARSIGDVFAVDLIIGRVAA
jgi:two-component system LytT family sensor kinase